MVVRIGRKKALQFRRIFLKEHREDAGLTQEQLAERLDTTKGTISRIENGKRDFTGAFLDAAAKALGKPDGRVFYSPPPEAELLERLASAPPGLKEQASAVLDAMLKTGTSK